jgi:hypothetical protein
VRTGMVISFVSIAGIALGNSMQACMDAHNGQREESTHASTTDAIAIASFDTTNSSPFADTMTRSVIDSTCSMTALASVHSPSIASAIVLANNVRQQWAPDQWLQRRP